MAVLLAKNPEGVSEVVNDLDGDLINFWRVLQHPEKFQEFLRYAQATPMAHGEWARATEGLGVYTDVVGRAWAFFVNCRQSLAGRKDAFTGITKTRTRRGMNGEVAAWLNAIEGLPEVHARLKRVLILNGKATDVIAAQDAPMTVFYVDPPYLHETRSETEAYGRYEMTDADHAALLDRLNRCKGAVLLSGYRSTLYDTQLWHWKRHDFQVANAAAGGKKKRRMTESVWTNFGGS